MTQENNLIKKIVAKKTSIKRVLSEEVDKNLDIREQLVRISENSNYNSDVRSVSRVYLGWYDIDNLGQKTLKSFISDPVGHVDSLESGTYRVRMKLK